MIEDQSSTSPRLVELLDEYLAACEGAGPANLDSLEERAGDEAEALRQHVAVVQRIRGLSGILDGHRHSQFGRFRCLELLGEGGYSAVYRAHDPDLDRDVALKVLAMPATSTAHNSMAEGRAIAGLDHPNVVKVYEVGEDSGHAYIAMELVRGIDLREVIRRLRSGAHPPESDSDEDELETIVRALATTTARCQLVTRISRALAYCHEKGVVHRDVKPENILINSELAPKLVDFGLARHQESVRDMTRGLRGTPSYFAPEQVDQRKGGVNAASDQFALGTLFYELLTLDHPFRADSLAETFSAISLAAPEPPRRKNPGVALDAELICLRCLERDPLRRYPSMAALADDLDAFLEHRAISIRPAGLVRRTLQVARTARKKVVVPTLAVCAGVLLTMDFVSQARARTEFLDELTSSSTSLPSMRDPNEFRRLFRQIDSSWIRATRIDRTWAGRLQERRSTDALADLWESAVERLDEAMQGPDRAIEPAKNAERFQAHLVAWDGLRHAAKLSGPSWKPPIDLPGPGTVDLPPGGLLFRFNPYQVPELTRLDAVDPLTTLRTGMYRYVVDIDGVTCEAEFVLRVEPRWSPVIRPISSEWKNAAITHPGGSRPSDAGGGDCASFRFSPQPVTWGDLSRVLGDTNLQPLFHVALSGEAPDDDACATVPWVFAQEYAVRIGARLPTPIESWFILTSTEAETDDLRAEWTSGFYSRDQSRRFARPTSRVDGPAGLEDHHEESHAGVGFRVVSSFVDAPG